MHPRSCRPIHLPLSGRSETYWESEGEREARRQGRRSQKPGERTCRVRRWVFAAENTAGGLCSRPSPKKFLIDHLGAAVLPLLSLLALAACTGPFRAGPDRYDYSTKPREHDFDRTGFGESPLPFWSALTPPEIRALSSADRAAAGDPEALLDLAILASGGPRSAAGFDSIHRSVDAFVAGAKPAIDAEPKPYRKGLLLHQAMHRELFLRDTSARAAAGGQGLGYDFHQSAVAPIFHGGRYNCVSSAVLYVILARKFGLHARGVILPTHVFVEIGLPDGRIIEVETTTPQGYDWVHDGKFYRDRAPGWFQARDLPPSTHKDYLERKIVEPLALLAHNMANQHTAPARMPQVDRCRLAEARAYIHPDDPEAQGNRLDFYNTEYLFLKNRRKDFASIAAMFGKVAPGLSDLGRRLAGDATLRNRLAWAWYEYAHVLHELGRDAEALPFVDSSLAALRLEEKNGPPVHGNNVSLLLKMASAAVEAGRPADAETTLLRHPALVKDNADMRKGLSWVYNRWGADLWEKQEWEGAIARFEKQKEFAPLSDRKRLSENMTGAYLNWAAGYQEQGDWSRVREVLAKCVERVNGARKCRELLDQVVAQHRLD
jgi:tetratricopeptide (TPR) repeat protein